MIMCTLGLAGSGVGLKMFLGDPSEKELPAQTCGSPWYCTEIFPALGLKLVAAFQIWNLRDLAGTFFSALGGKDSLTVLGRLASGYVFTQISALEMLLLVCTVGELDFPLLK